LRIVRDTHDGLISQENSISSPHHSRYHFAISDAADGDSKPVFPRQVKGLRIFSSHFNPPIFN
jgi:hypothetical protein